MWVTLAVPEVPEILGTTGLDAVLIDLEHTTFGLREVEMLVRASDAAGITALVRPPSTDPTIVARVLDAGAYGIVFPMIESARDAELAVSCTRYQPHGTRGWGGAHTRHARWQGSYVGAEPLPGSGQAERSVYSDDYIDKANSEVLTIVIVESVAGVERIDEIVSVKGVDAVIFGWGDFSVESGFDWSRSREAALVVYEACRQAAVGCALTAGSKLGDVFFPGCFYVVGIDSLIVSAALADAVASASRAADSH